MKISMIMGTLNRRELMKRAVGSILVQSHQDFEIIIVDQSDEPNDDIASADARIHYVHIDQRGLSLARNIGISMATGSIVGLMDDDAVYGETILEKVNGAFECDDDLGIVVGRIIDPRFREEERSKKNGRKKLKYGNFFKYCISPSMFIRKKYLDEIKFDEELGVGRYLGSAEESDITLRIMYKKTKAEYLPDAIIFHHTGSHSDIRQMDLDKHKSYCRGYGAFCAKHIYEYKNIHVLLLYGYSMVRTFGGYCLSKIRKDEYMKMFYVETMKSRQEGFRVYRKKARIGNSM